jgi:hypothetical protein
MLYSLPVGAYEGDSADVDTSLTGHGEGRFGKHLSQGDVQATEQIDAAGAWVRCCEDRLPHARGKWPGEEGFDGSSGDMRAFFNPDQGGIHTISRGPRHEPNHQWHIQPLRS